MRTTEPAIENEPQLVSPHAVKTQPSIKSKVGQVIKRTATVAGSTVLVGASAIAIAIAPVVAPLAFPAAVLAADSILYSIRGVNGSMFEVDHKNRIKQRINPLPVLFKHRGESSSEIFQEETKKLFEGLKPGETYTTRSQAMTYALLRNAQREGRILNLTKEKAGSSRLLLEKIVTGNWKAIRAGRKHDMYDISFEVAKRN